MGRFINADAYASTGQGVLGNNMFAYCGNNPIRNFDPYGCASKICFGDYVNPLGFPWQDPMGGGGHGYAMVFAYHYSDDLADSGSYEEREKTMFGGTRRTRIMPWEYAFLQLSNEGISLIDISASLATVSFEWDFPDFTITPYDAVSANISAGLNHEKGLHASAIAYLWKPSLSFNILGVDISVFGYFGAIGGEFALSTSTFTIGGASHGVGGGFSIFWDN